MIAIRLKDDKKEYAPGETLAGTIEWSLDEAPESIELCLVWFTAGRGTQDISVVERQPLNNVHRGGERPFSFTLPPGPPSFEGKLITLRWAVEAVAQPQGEFVRERIDVLTDGEKFILSSCSEKSLCESARYKAEFKQ